MPDDEETLERSPRDGAETASRWMTLRWIVVGAMVLCAVAYLVAVPLGGVSGESRLGTADVVLGVALIAGFAFFGSLTQVDLTSAGVSFKIRGLERRTEALQSELELVRNRATRLFLNTMAPSMYGQLVKLRARGFTDYNKTDDFK